MRRPLFNFFNELEFDGQIDNIIRWPHALNKCFIQLLLSELKIIHLKKMSFRGQTLTTVLVGRM